MDDKLSVGFIQFEVTNDIEHNVSYVKSELKKLTRYNMNLIVLPEMWSCGFKYNIMDNAVKRTPALVDHISDVARDKKVTIIGSLPEDSTGKLYNTAFCIGPNGKVLNKYRKIHLFPPLGENDHFSPGNKVATIKVSGVKVGVVICFDIRFPELIRTMAFDGMQLLVVCAQWPKVRYEQWMILLKARAIENQVFVVAANRCGVQDGHEYLGHSVIINPYGELVYEAHGFEESIEALIDLGIIKRFKAQFDTVSLARPDKIKK